jgi:hypothetical protein
MKVRIDSLVIMHHQVGFDFNFVPLCGDDITMPMPFKCILVPSISLVRVNVKSNKNFCLMSISLGTIMETSIFGIFVHNFNFYV